jgi:hypothetical protein
MSKIRKTERYTQHKQKSSVLTAANTCIIHDLDFNPFNELQAEDQCHRIGQKKKITVYKVCLGCDALMDANFLCCVCVCVSCSFHQQHSTQSLSYVQLVTKETVDADTFKMQERKFKMNAAIMESNVDKKQHRDMLQTAVNRFLLMTTSPHAKKKKKLPESTDVKNKENEKEVIFILYLS